MNGIRYHATDSSPGGNEFNLTTDIVFDIPDFTKLRQDRQKRVSDVIQKLDKNELHSQQYEAAVTIQRVFRGYLDRKMYFDKLFDNVLKGEEALKTQQLNQVLDGEVLIENYKMEQELNDETDINRNRLRFLTCAATTIQRAWRNYASKKQFHICCSCLAECPDLFKYYNESRKICFCCDYHKENPEAFEEWSNYPNLSSNHEINTVNLLESRDVSCTLISTELDFDIDKNNNLSVKEKTSHGRSTYMASYDYPSYNISDEIENIMEQSDFFGHTRNHHSETPIEESTRVLKLLQIHNEYEDRKRVKKSKNACFDRKDLASKSKRELKLIVSSLEQDISIENNRLLQELSLRDDLNLEHEALLMDVGDLEKKSQ